MWRSDQQAGFTAFVFVCVWCNEVMISVHSGHSGRSADRGTDESQHHRLKLSTWNTDLIAALSCLPPVYCCTTSDCFSQHRLTSVCVETFEGPPTHNVYAYTVSLIGPIPISTLRPLWTFSSCHIVNAWLWEAVRASDSKNRIGTFIRHLFQNVLKKPFINLSALFYC